MKEKEEKGTKSRQKAPKLHVLLRIFVIIFAIFTIFRVIAQQPLINQYKLEKEECEKAIQAEKENIEYYENRKEFYQTEEGKKIVAKERLGMVGENEKVYIDANGK